MEKFPSKLPRFEERIKTENFLHYCGRSNRLLSTLASPGQICTGQDPFRIQAQDPLESNPTLGILPKAQFPLETIGLKPYNHNPEKQFSPFPKAKSFKKLRIKRITALEISFFFYSISFFTTFQFGTFLLMSIATL